MPDPISERHFDFVLMNPGLFDGTTQKRNKLNALLGINGDSPKDKALRLVMDSLPQLAILHPSAAVACDDLLHAVRRELQQ